MAKKRLSLNGVVHSLVENSVSGDWWSWCMSIYIPYEQQRTWEDCLTDAALTCLWCVARNVNGSRLMIVEA